MIGAVSGVILFVGMRVLEEVRVDDAVSAVPVHLMCGIWGTLAVALVGRPELWNNGHTRWEQFLVQLGGVGAIGTFSFGGASRSCG